MLANHCYDEINGNKEVANHRVIRVAMVVVPAMPLSGLYAIRERTTTLTRVTLSDTCNIAQFSATYVSRVVLSPATRQFLPSPAKIATCKFEQTRVHTPPPTCWECDDQADSIVEFSQANSSVCLK